LFVSFIFIPGSILSFRINQVFKYLLCVNGWGDLMGETVLLKISKKGDKGFQVCSVPLQKVKRMASDKHRFWSIEGDFLVLHSY
jgi:hypothetical protein